MSVIIPWQNSADFQFEVALDRFVYLLRARYNWRAGVYALDLFTRNRSVIALGLCVVRNQDLFAGMTHPDAPRGRAYIIGEAPTLENLLNGSSLFVYDGVVDAV